MMPDLGSLFDADPHRRVQGECPGFQVTRRGRWRGSGRSKTIRLYLTKDAIGMSEMVRRIKIVLPTHITLRAGLTMLTRQIAKLSRQLTALLPDIEPFGLKAVPGIVAERATRNAYVIDLKLICQEC
jgi:hypothetical protein